MGQFVTHADETVMPDRCDPKLFSQTFELRSQRYEIEQVIENTKAEIKLITTNSMNVAFEELETIEYEIKQIEIELEKNRVSITYNYLFLMKYYNNQCRTITIK